MKSQIGWLKMDENTRKAALVALARKKLEEKRAAATQDRSIWDKVVDNVVGRDDGVMSPGEKAAALLNMGGEAMSMGLVGDEAAAGADALVGRGTYDDRLQRYRGNEQQMWRDHPALSVASQIAPALLPGAGAANLISKIPTVAGKMAGGGALGGMAGGLFGFMEGEGGLEQRLQSGRDNAGLAGAVGAAVPGLGAAYRGVRNSRALHRAAKKAAQGAPTTEQLQAAGNALYDQVDNLGVQIKPEAFDRARAGVLDRLRANTGFDELPGPGSLTPHSARSMQIMDAASNRMASEPTEALPFKAVDQMRRQAGAAAGNVSNKTDQRAGMEIISGLDDFVGRLSADDVVAGDVQALPALINKARDTWTRMSKSQKIDDAIEASDSYLSGPGSGLKYQFKRILKNKKLSRGFSDAEKAVMKRVVNGTIPEQILRTAGSGLTQIGGALGAGLAVNPVAGAGVFGLSKGARALSDHIIGKNAELARRVVANGGIPDGSVQQITGPGLIDALMLSGTVPR